MSTRNAVDTVPRWQEITGLSPDLEPYMSRDERETAIRTLVEEVQCLAVADFARKTPQGERTYLYDPIHFICNTLGISRVKLSRYTQELTGMSAYEVTDKIKAKSLPDVLKKVVAARVDLMRADLVAAIDEAIQEIKRDGAKLAGGERDHFRRGLEDIHTRCLLMVQDSFRRERAGTNIVAWAANLGYANPARLRRAAILAHGRSVESLEEQIIDERLRTLIKERLEANAAAQKETEPQPEKIAPHNNAASASGETTTERKRPNTEAAEIAEVTENR